MGVFLQFALAVVTHKMHESNPLVAQWWLLPRKYSARVKFVSGSRTDPEERMNHSSKTKKKSLSDYEDSLIAAVLSLYCEPGRRQNKIADLLNENAKDVSYIIQGAKERGLLTIKPRLPNEKKIAGELHKMFPKAIRQKEVLVVPLGRIKNKKQRLEAIGRAGAVALEDRLGNDTTLAIDGGECVARVIESVQEIFTDLELFPLAGGPLLSPLTSVPALIGRFLGTYGAASRLKAHLLPGPSEDAQELVRQSSEIHNTLKKIARAKVYLIGVGAIGEKCSGTARLLLDQLGIKKDDLKENDVVGVTAYNAFNRDGRHVRSGFDQKIVKIKLDDLRNAAKSKKRSVILVAVGPEKAVAIAAMIRGGLVNVFVTDDETGNAVLEASKA